MLESKARLTWNGEYWKLGGGGTAWESMAYDPKLDLLYFGTGNGSPVESGDPQPRKGGDNLFVASIIAVRPTPASSLALPGDAGGEWDYSANQHIVLADLTIDGKERQC